MVMISAAVGANILRRLLDSNVGRYLAGEDLRGFDALLLPPAAIRMEAGEPNGQSMIAIDISCMTLLDTPEQHLFCLFNRSPPCDMNF